MYACICQTERGFFEGVCTPNNATAKFCDPPLSAKEQEPHCQGSGPKRITSCATVGGALA
jgi:hypothetical protein